MKVIGSQRKRQRGVTELLSGEPGQRHVWQWVSLSCPEEYQLKRQNSLWEPPATLEIMQAISVICVVLSLSLYFSISNRISTQMIEFDSVYFSSSCFRKDCHPLLCPSISALNACKPVSRTKESFVVSKGNICFLIFFLTINIS